MRRLGSKWWVVVGLATAAGMAAAQTSLPAAESDRHLGVKSCSSAACHGSAAPRGPHIQGNEHTTWLQRDRHARAYQSLLSERSQRIAANLGLPRPAHESPQCLVCHADFVPEERRGEQFALEDGVGCEACHGGSERWIDRHVSGALSRQEVRALGMFPTQEPRALAAQCLACHSATGPNPLRHRMMAAGHPRTSFELDTFLAVQPPHSNPKERPPAIRRWAMGQAIAVALWADALADPQRARDDGWPELTFFDCHACHHPMSEGRWAPRDRGALDRRPGAIPLDDSGVRMLAHAAYAFAPETTAALLGTMADLDRTFVSATADPTRDAMRLRAQALSIADAIERTSIDRTVLRRLVESLSRVPGSEVRDYALAEQLAMVYQSVVTAEYDLGGLDAASLETANAALSEMLGAARDPEHLDRRRFARALARLRGLLQGLEAGGSSQLDSSDAAPVSSTDQTAPSRSR